MGFQTIVLIIPSSPYKPCHNVLIAVTGSVNNVLTQSTALDINSNRPSSMLVNNVVKEKSFSNSASLSNPNFSNTHATKSFTRSRGIVIRDVAKPSIPPLSPPRKPSSFHPSIIPVIVSHAVVTIAIGANTLPTTPAILVTIPPNLLTLAATLLNQNLTLFAGPIILSLIIVEAVEIGVIIFFIR